MFYFRGTGISTPRNSTSPRRLTQLRNGLPPLHLLLTPIGWLLLFLHVEAKEFERLVAVDPAVPRMWVEKEDVIGLVGDFAVLFAILVVQGHLASAADYVKNVSLFRRSFVKS